MQRFKKRVRLLAEQLNCSIDYGPNDSLRIQASSGSATFTPKSYELMTCSIDLVNGSRTFLLSKKYVFDIMDRLGMSLRASTLLDYPKMPILTLHDYIEEEQGLRYLRALQQELASNPAVVHKEFGGNRILAEYFYGVLVLRDELVIAATNVIEFSASSPALEKAT